MNDIRYFHMFDRKSNGRNGGATCAYTFSDNMNSMVITLAVCKAGEPFTKRIGREVATKRLNGFLEDNPKWRTHTEYYPDGYFGDIRPYIVVWYSNEFTPPIESFRGHVDAALIEHLCAMLYNSWGELFDMGFLLPEFEEDEDWEEDEE